MLDELVHQQDEVGAEIQRLIVNYKRDGAARKTSEYLQKRLSAIEDLWEQFEQTDLKIRTYHGTELQHPYFTKDYYEIIRQKYDDIRADIEAKIGESKTKNLNTSTEDLASFKSPLLLPTPIGQQVYPHSLSNVGAPKEENLQLTQRIERQSIVITTILSTLRKLLNDQTQHSDQFYSIKIKTIKQHWESAQKLHQKICDSMDELHTKVYNINDYFKQEEEIENALIELCERASTIPVTQAARSEILTSAATTAMQLPKVVLPKFDGDYSKWRQFRDLFSELVHNQQIPQCQKMWYLKTSVIGEAEKLIRHFTISDANYVSAWSTINERYENTRLLVTALLNKLMSQPTMQNENASTIKALHDTTQECLLSLENLGINTEGWDPIILHMLIKRLDRNTHTLWEQSLTQPKQLPSLKEFLTFLETRFQSLEALGVKLHKSSIDGSRNKGQGSSRIWTSTTVATLTCISCKGNHPLYACQRFLQMQPKARLNLVQKFKHCVNCLKSGHRPANCPSRACTVCQGKHNTLLHLQTTLRKEAASTSTNHHTQKDDALSNSVKKPAIQGSTLASSTKTHMVLLGTAVVNVIDNWGSPTACRAILDSGSQVNFVTDALVQKLGLRREHDTLRIEGIGQQQQQAQQRVNLQIQSQINGFSTRIEAHILSKIISPQPPQQLNVSNWMIPRNIVLADANFHQPGTIDMLIGAEIFYSILAIGQIKLPKELPILQNTLFGWTVSGKVSNVKGCTTSTVCGISTKDELLNQHIERFWQLEEVNEQANNYTAAERRCENQFEQTTKRNSDGRLIVRLPFCEDPQTLGESKDIAYQRFKAIERKLIKNNELRTQYVNFMKEYLTLGHMEKVCFNNIQKPYYFLPHHCVVKPDSSTTKLRVVFDGSTKTSTNVSLNDIISKGPTIQDDVFTILLRFRFPRFVFTADIEKMYRQVLIHPADRQYQLIWWRDDPNQPIQCFQLTTVTYGTTSAPYLATRCLHNLADRESKNFPLGAEILKRDFYVDDVLTGADQLTTAIEMQSQLQDILRTAGFKLRKWCANHPRLLQHIIPTDQEVQLDFNNRIEENVKTMGLIWLPKTDSFTVKCITLESGQITKRTASSDIARIFDPLGLLSPVVILAKLFLQELWTLKLDWDAALPQNLHSTWVKFRKELITLHNIKVPRHVFGNQIPKEMQIHIFSDASERAYGAAAYVRTINSNNTVIVRLLCAKSKVAPIKQITLPRLELCAAKLAAELSQRLRKDLCLKNEILFWTDSTATLGWINSNSSNFHTFVANRISTIQQITLPQQWRHVKSEDNPADLLSRGILPGKLADNHLWFYGPSFLHGNETVWPKLPDKLECTIELREKKRTVLTTTHYSNNLIEGIEHQNSFRRLQRILAYVHHFINKLRKRTNNGVTALELENSLLYIVKTIQQHEFKEDVAHIRKYGEIPKSSSISTLAPFVDEKGVLRVGGRLESSNVDYDSKHPILLPYAHIYTKMLLKDLHNENHHPGPQTLLAIARQKFWPLKGKILARSVVQHCVRCTRIKPRLLTQLMGNLPVDRVQPARPFVNSGVDFCGPVWVHFKTRGRRPQKAYIAVFCCFATKAVHLELVGDLSSAAFIGALKRFMARRGHCKTMYCDNATNFVGAKNQLQEVQYILENDTARGKILAECNLRGTDFKFIPPRSPHFGGLWEAAVKSAKHFLQRTVANASLTHEELETVVVEIEAIMNSRPITPLSSDPNDLTALTPAHLLIGEPLTSNVDPRAQPLQTNLLTRWKLVSHLKNEFWRKWSHEYLNQLQQRYKWKQKCSNILPGTIVIIKDDNLPPMKWPLGRILKAIKGEDGLVRVADIQTATSIIRRPIHRLAPLPTEDEYQQTPTNNIPNSSSQEQPQQEEKQTPVSRSTNHQTTSTTTNITPNSRKRARISTGAAIVTLLLTCCAWPSTQATQINATPLQSNPGIYFENLGTTHIISSEWNLIVYYNMNLYWTHFGKLQNYSRILEKTCLLAHNSEPCSKISSQLAQMMDELHHNNQLLQPSSKPRKKRGAINIIGNVANALFGVLDNEYAQQMSATIDNIQQNEEHLVSLLKNQTSFLDTTINVIKKDHKTIQKEFQHIEQLFNKTTSQLNSVQYKLYEEEVFRAFTLIAMQTMLAVSNFQRIQGSILDILTDTHHGKINSLLLSPRQLEDELRKIKGNLPTHLKLPIQTTDILKFYNTMSISGRVTKKYIIFKLRLPLIFTEDFELFKLISIPVKMNNSYMAIQPSFPFLIVNLHRDQYQPLTEQELKDCISMDSENHICQQRHPLYRIGSSTSACELSLLNKLTPGPVCSVIKMEPGPHWIQMHNPNQWIYSVDKPQTINAVCGTNMTQITIKDAGILTIHGDCLIKQPLITMQGYNPYSTINRMAFIPSINFSHIVSPLKMEPALRYSNNYFPHLNELETIKEEVLKLNHQLPNQTLAHQVHHYTLGYTTLFSITGIIIYLVWRARKKSQIQSSQSSAVSPKDDQGLTEPKIITILGKQTS